jgi:hypothetical protein
MDVLIKIYGVKKLVVHVLLRQWPYKRFRLSKGLILCMDIDWSKGSWLKNDVTLIRNIDVEGLKARERAPF